MFTASSPIRRVASPDKGKPPPQTLCGDLHNDAIGLGLCVILLASDVLTCFRQFLLLSTFTSPATGVLITPPGFLLVEPVIPASLSLCHTLETWLLVFFVFLLCTIMGPQQQQRINAHLMGREFVADILKNQRKTLESP